MICGSIGVRQSYRDSIGIELCFEGRRREFVLSEGNVNAISVGSEPQSHVRICRADVAPSHFRIERDERRVWIVPTYAVNTRVNGTWLAVPRVIIDQAVVEVSGLRIYIRVLRGQPPGYREPSWDLETLGWANQTAGNLSIRFGSPPIDARSDKRATPSIAAAIRSNDEITLSDPIGAPARTHVAPSRAFDQKSTPRAITPRQKWLSALGALGIRQPRIVWLGGSLFLFTLSALLSWTIRHCHDTRVRVARPNAATSPSPDRSTGKPPAAVTSPGKRSSAIAAPSMALASQSENARSSVLRAAAGHLISGQYADAQREYSTLTAEAPADPALEAMAKFLSAQLTARCNHAMAEGMSCPEIKR